MTTALPIPSLSRIRATKHSPLVLRHIAQYESVASRHRFLWKWAAHGIEMTTLSAVPAAARQALLDTKLLCVILNVLLDDLADQRGDAALLDKALAIPLRAPQADPLAGVPEPERPYLQCIADTWDALWSRIQALPRFDRYQALLRFDYQQVFNCMRYGLLLRDAPALVNATENSQYQPHNMNMMVFATLDLMASPTIPDAALGALRGAISHAQCMGQISNMVVTWQREVPDRDFSSRIFALGLQTGVFSAQELQRLSAEEITRRVQDAGLEALLLQEWRDHHRHLRSCAAGIAAIDLDALSQGLTSLLRMTLASRGRL